MLWTKPRKTPEQYAEEAVARAMETVGPKLRAAIRDCLALTNEQIATDAEVLGIPPDTIKAVLRRYCPGRLPAEGE